MGQREINQIIGSFANPPTFRQATVLFLLGIVMWVRMRPYVAAFLLLLIVLGALNGASIILVVVFGLTLLYSGGFVRDVRTLNAEIHQRARNKFDDTTLGLLGVVLGVTVAVTASAFGHFEDPITSAVFDLTLLASMVAGSALFMAFFISRGMKRRAQGLVYFFPFVMQLLVPNILAGYNQTQYYVLSFLPVTLAFLMIPIAMIWYFRRLFRPKDSIDKASLVQGYTVRVNSKPLSIERELFYAQMAGEKPLDCIMLKIESVVGMAVFHVGIFRNASGVVATRIYKEGAGRVTDEERETVLRTVAFSEIAKSIPRVGFSFRRSFGIVTAKMLVPLLDESVEGWQRNIAKATTDEERRKLDVTGVQTRVLFGEESTETRRFLDLLSVESECTSDIILQMTMDCLSRLTSVLERELDPWSRRAFDYKEAYPKSTSLRVGERLMGGGKKSSAEIRFEFVKSRLESVRQLKQLLVDEITARAALLQSKA